MLDCTLYTDGAFHDADFPEPTWLVDQVIPFGGTCLLHGPKTAGKTQLMLTLGVSILTGTPFLNEFRVAQGGVLLIEADMTRRLLQDRMKGSDATRGIAVLHAEPFDVVDVVKNLAKLPVDFQKARDTNPALVMIDSLRKTSRQDEKDSASPTLVYEAWRLLFPNATRLISHHDRKKPTDPRANLHADEAARGTGAWLDDADGGMRLARPIGGKAGEHHAILSFTKYRGEEPPTIHLQMNEDSLLLEPVKQTARQVLWAWRQKNPKATAEDARNFLLENKLCRRTVAYRLAAEVCP